MNPEACELSELTSEASSVTELQNETEALGPDWELLPIRFGRSARSVLKGRARASFSRNSGGKLSRYAHRRRQQRYRGR